MTKRKKIFFGTVFVTGILIFLGLFFIDKEYKPASLTDEFSSEPYVILGKPALKGNRVLALDINMAEDNNYDKAFALAQSAGTEAVSFTIHWNGLEKTKEELQDSQNLLTIANIYYPSRKTKVNFIIVPFDTVGRQVPEDLKDVPFDDPWMIERFKTFLDFVFSKMPDVEFTFVLIGNEIDIGLSFKDWEEKNAYEKFFQEAKQHLKLKRPGLKIGTAATLYGLIGPRKEDLKSINSNADIIAVSYYPLNELNIFGTSVKDPSVVRQEIGSLLEVYPDKPVYFSEIGYPSSSLLDSSGSKQREFIREVFKTWDAHKDKIHLMTFAWLTDLPISAVDDFSSYYGVGNNEFKEYLRTLGLRTYAGSGQDKQAFRALKAEAKARGWKSKISN